MKTKLLAALLLTLAGSGNAFAAKSATAPLIGLYAGSSVEVCLADTSTPTTISVPNGFHILKAGRYTFIPDAAAASYSAWVTSVVSLGFPNPASALNITQDPTTTTVRVLAETPIQWGTMFVQKIEEQITSPLTGPATLTKFTKTNQFILTTFTYFVPTNNNGVKTGYRLYTISVGDNHWGTGDLGDTLVINKTTGLVTSGAGINHYSNSNLINGINYNYDCVENTHLTQ